MKQNKLFLSFVFVMTMFFCFVAIADDTKPAFETTKSFSKLDASLQKIWTDAKVSNNFDQRIDCFVRGEQNFDRGDKSFLISAGYNVRMISGPIATGYMNLKDLPDVANLPIIVTIKNASK